ncbi:putative epsilon-adaptin [Trypanosoma cruzi]|uniref:AP-4 complex subunit epsilon n=2 Tax=Trypanosoma cruzi TaxID=5693 RepID=Q4DVU3_TRYCC|nr:epsilon-adaptin, putative [Trypanosoma cruzi]EAN96655.1 epsilon-adaptin, putative [Trypanosoma cruzi]PWU94540.1 putative epsilon-adaptin [Trypanosoma cruzi]RNC57467.1 putative epsilon-adaptin putativeAP-1/4 adapter complex gamma/epsilon subunit [Trypanosoma cruzi]|eukprot:XP_818506.1 epsilon-adaptin [Trypanosoma cruzi strain CL Brener]
MSKLYRAQTQQGHSRGFFEYIRSVGESKSKQEEDAIVTRDLAELKKTLASNNIEKRLLKEYVVRIFYAEMLGVSAEFAHIHCVNLSSSPDLLSKRTGYLGTWLTVGPEHDLMYLIVSNLQRDMKSSSFLDIAAALTAASKLVRLELMNAINTEVVGLLRHPNALVRKKAVSTMHAFYRKSEGLIGDTKIFRQMLCDADPSVMGAALPLFADVICTDPTSQRELISIFLSILKQIGEHRLSREYEYHGIPAPWLQIKLLQMLPILIGDEPSLARKCEEALREVITRADNGLVIGYAVMCEAIRVITLIPTIPTLVELAAEAISKFLSARKANLRYAGIQALSQIVRLDPKYAHEHQHVVMACLEEADDTIRRKTMMLLLAMCNEDNVEVIVTRLVKSLSQTTDKYFREEFTRRICDAVDRFSPGAVWYIETMNKLLLCAAEHVPQMTIQGILKLIVEGEGKDGEKDAAFRTFCVETYFDLLEGSQKNLPEAFCRVAAWVIGEYGFLAKRISRTMLLDRLCDMLERAECADTRGWIIMAMIKIVAHAGAMPDNVEDLITRFKDSRSVWIQQRCYEFSELVKMPVLMKKVLPLDGCCEEVDLDESMGFLDGIVQEALLAGARPYEKREILLGVKEEETLRTDAYELVRTDVVNENELDPENFKTEEPHKLVIRPAVKRWGLKNLEEDITPTEENPTAGGPDASEATGSMECFSEGAVLHHVDPHAPSSLSTPSAAVNLPMPREVSKPSKNKKFLNDIFSVGNKKKLTVRGHNGATESLVHAGKGSEENDAGSLLSIHMEYVRELATTGVVVRFVAKVGVENVVISMRAPPNCTLRFVSCSATSATVDGTAVTLNKLQANQPVELEMQVLPVGFPKEGRVKVEITYRSAVPGDPQCASVSRALSARDILRPPAQMTTAEFGQTWVGLREECKLQMSSAAPLTPQSLQNLLLERASLRVVEVIRNELITAAKLIGTGKPVLCHVDVVGPNAANVKVRADDKGFAAYVAHALSAP